MKPSGRIVIIALVIVTGVAVAALWSHVRSERGVIGETPDSGARADVASRPLEAPIADAERGDPIGGAPGEEPAPGSGSLAAEAEGGEGRTRSSATPEHRASGDAAPVPARRGRSWPVRKARPRASGASADAAAGAPPEGEPIVPVPLAFRALWYLGVDPEAETTWRRAINDPHLAPGVRSDLIVDMIDEGYTDNDRPTRADLPVILARLGIVERHAPYAMDRVNAEAFETAYRHLLEMYVRLGGRPRDGG